MSAYRIYCLDDEGLVVRARVIEAPSDAKALSVAAVMMKHGVAQPWTGTRLVGTLKEAGWWQSSSGVGGAL